MLVLAPMNFASLHESSGWSRHTDYMAKAVPGANHLFEKCETGDPAEFFKQKLVITAEALKGIGGYSDGTPAVVRLLRIHVFCSTAVVDYRPVGKSWFHGTVHG